MKVLEKKSAIEMRKTGKSLGYIASKLNVSKSTVSRWTRGISLTSEQLDIFHKDRVEKIKCLSKVNRLNAIKRREIFFQKGFDRAKVDLDFRLICALYWGEGDKSENLFAITNADHSMLNFVGTWLLKEGWEDKISFRVFYHELNDIDEEKIKLWWKDKLDFLKNTHFRKFTKLKIRRSSQSKNIGKLPYGTARLTICNTGLLYNVYGGIDFLKTQYFGRLA